MDRKLLAGVHAEIKGALNIQSQNQRYVPSFNVTYDQQVPVSREWKKDVRVSLKS